MRPLDIWYGLICCLVFIPAYKAASVLNAVPDGAQLGCLWQLEDSEPHVKVLLRGTMAAVFVAFRQLAGGRIRSCLVITVAYKIPSRMLLPCNQGEPQRAPTHSWVTLYYAL